MNRDNWARVAPQPGRFGLDLTAPAGGRRESPSILVLTGGDPERAPSGSGSLKSLSRAFENVGIQTIIQDIEDTRPFQVDGAFIRTLTKVGGEAHRIAEEFELAGLPVLDRPSSIVRGCDKVHQAMLFGLAGVPTPKTALVTAVAHAKKAQQRIGSWPIVVKDPKGSFCSGVTVAHTREELEAAVEQHCRNVGSAVLQGFVASEFDWRIGVLDHEILFAAKYWMAAGSWKVREDQLGGARWGDCTPVPVEEVPSPVLEAARAASRATGPGLWGIDVKLVDDHAVVIEINDNPNIDDDVEAAIEGDRVWPRLAEWFAIQINRARNQHRGAAVLAA